MTPITQEYLTAWGVVARVAPLIGSALMLGFLWGAL